MERTSASLLARLKQPEVQQQAWSRFVDLYTPLLYYWARRARLQQADAADLVQEVFAIVLTKIGKFDYDQTKSFRSWLRTVAMNKWREKLRRQSEAVPGDSALGEVADSNNVESFWELEYRDQLIRRALEVMRADFEPATWNAVWEFVVNARPAAEVAAQFGFTVNAVYLAKGRVLRRLREELADLLD